jgi:predicted nucleic acid-binding protein
MLFDTNFIIAYQRGTKDVPRARAKAFLEAQPAAAPF